MGRTFFQILIPCLLVSMLFAACNKEGSQGAQPTNAGSVPPTGSADDRNVYVVCEGAYGNGNASLYMQDLFSLVIYDNVYLNLNGNGLGDVFQSIERIDDQLFLCVNNSDKIIVLDAATRKLKGEISIPKPRYIQQVNPEKAYVGSLYSNKLYIINPKTLNIQGSIDMPAKNAEGMMVQGVRAYICTWDTACNKVYIVNTLTDKLTDSFEIAGYAPQHALADANGFVWVLSGNVEKGKKAALTKLAPGTADIVASFQFKDLQDVIKPVFNNVGDELLYIGVDYQGNSGYNGIFRMNVNDGALPTIPLIPAQKFQYYWGLGIDPITDEIYVGDPKGFVQKGTVTVYNNKGEQKRVFDVGIGPGYFYFDGK